MNSNQRSAFFTLIMNADNVNLFNIIKYEILQSIGITSVSNVKINNLIKKINTDLINKAHQTKEGTLVSYEQFYRYLGCYLLSNQDCRILTNRYNGNWAFFKNHINKKIDIVKELEKDINIEFREIVYGYISKDIFKQDNLSFLKHLQSLREGSIRSEMMYYTLYNQYTQRNILTHLYNDQMYDFKYNMLREHYINSAIQKEIAASNVKKQVAHEEEYRKKRVITKSTFTKDVEKRLRDRFNRIRTL